MSVYATRQRKALTDFLMRHADRAFSADEAAHTMREETPGTAPSRSTVYRLLTELAGDGVIRRFFEPGDRQATYQYVGDAHCEAHLHMRCARCGTLFHLSDELTARLRAAVWNADQFSIDNRETVLVGTCADCARE